MRSGGYLGGTVEFGMMQAGAAQLGHFYGVPVYGSGGMTDAKVPDVQAGYEKMSTLLLAAMGGCDYIHHAIGMITNMNSTSLEQAVIDDEIVGMVMRILRGMEVTPATLGVEAIQRVGPGGHYLLDDHTRQFMRAEHFLPALADRQSRGSWDLEGKRDARQRARARVEKILAGHAAPGLPPEMEAALRLRFPLHDW